MSRKKPTVLGALVWALVLPGAGHMYAGSTIRGTLVLISAIGMVAMVPAIAAMTGYVVQPMLEANGLVEEGGSPWVGGLLVLGVFWGAQALSAMIAAAQAGRR